MLLDTRPEDVGLSTPRLARIGEWMRGWVDSGRFPGLLVAVVRDERLAWLETCGRRDVESARPVEPDTIYRIYSMTKPITTVAALMLYEEGRFQLDDPVDKFIPAFAATRVFASGDAESFTTVPLARPITVHDLMVHTSGLTYGFQHEHAVDALYRNRGVEFNANLEPLADLTEAAAAQPLVFQPGTRWNYSVSTDVLGRLVEIWSGVPLDAFLRRAHLRSARDERHGLSCPRGAGEPAGVELRAGRGRRAQARRVGGREPVPRARGYALGRRRSGLDRGGLPPVHADAARPRNARRHPDPRAQERRADDHEPPAGRPRGHGPAAVRGDALRGGRLRLGVSVLLDPARARILGSPGEYAWGGMASTTFWVDPAEDMMVLLLTQLMPSSAWPIRRELRVLTYQALL